MDLHTDTQGDTERHRERDAQRHTRRDKHTHRHTRRHTRRHTHARTHTHTHTHTHKPTESWTCICSRLIPRIHRTVESSGGGAREGGREWDVKTGRARGGVHGREGGRDRTGNQGMATEGEFVEWWDVVGRVKSRQRPTPRPQRMCRRALVCRLAHEPSRCRGDASFAQARTRTRTGETIPD